MRHAIAAIAAAALLGLGLGSSHSTSSSESPSGNHLLTERPERPRIALRHAVEIQRLRDVANELEMTGDLGFGVWATVSALENRDPANLPRDSRIVLQNAALRIAAQLERRRGEDDEITPLERRATVLAKRHALPRITLALLAHAPVFAAEEWLGSEDEWVERTTRRCGNGPLLHERAFRGLLAFHPVRSGDRRALISKLVAVDDEGNPHITPIVESIEMRLGMTDDAPAAVLELDMHSLGRGLTRVHAPPYDEVHRSQFVERDGAGGFTCARRCHQNSSSWGAGDVLDADEAQALRARRAIKLLSYARRRVDSLEL